MSRPPHGGLASRPLNAQLISMRREPGSHEPALGARLLKSTARDPLDDDPDWLDLVRALARWGASRQLAQPRNG